MVSFGYQNRLNGTEPGKTMEITDLRKLQEQSHHSQLLATVREMMAGIANEVNNPLGSILLYSQLLMAGDISPLAKKDLKVIHDEARRAASVMSYLLTYCRQEKLELYRVDINRIIEEFLRKYHHPETSHKITITSDLKDGPLTVKGDSSRLNQLFENLVLNAEEALEKADMGHVTITTRREGDWVKISVTDDGPGIPPGNLQQIFYPFFTTKQPREGSGLGLSTCYGIVTNHKGLIFAENNETGGVTFTVELPLADALEKTPTTKDIKTAGSLVI
jgi:signal transduction histidine kinase